METVGRNDPCPCGSEQKFKRCCLDITRAALRMSGSAESRLAELGELVRADHMAEWQAAFETKIGPISPTGTVRASEVAWLDTWLVCDAPIIGGRTPLDVAPEPHAVDAQLRTSTIGAWWARGRDFPLPASDWRYDEPLTLHSRHEPFGEVTEGALLVARAIDIGRDRLALVGRPVVVDDDAVDDILALLARSPPEALCAALRWPEEREHTREGEVVRSCLRRYELSMPLVAIEIARHLPALVEDRDTLAYWEDDVRFEVLAPASSDVVVPPAEPGVVYELCSEDSSDPQWVGECTLSPEDGEIVLCAVTSRRADQLLEAIPDQLRSLVGDMVDEDIDAPDATPRVRRVFLESLFAEA